jgi:hypothetical protein
MLFANYLKQGIAFLVSLSNTPPRCNRYVMEPKIYIYIYLGRGIARPLNNSKHKQYPFNNMDKKNLIHIVYKIYL